MCWPRAARRSFWPFDRPQKARPQRTRSGKIRRMLYLDVQQVDLASLASIRAFAERIRSSYDGLDGIVANAGVMAIDSARTSTDSRCSSAPTISATSSWSTGSRRF